MTEGRVIEWMKKEGEQVRAGDVLANVESEKLEFPVESPVSGVLKQILVAAGQTVAVAQPIAVVTAESAIQH